MKRLFAMISVFAILFCAMCGAGGVSAETELYTEIGIPVLHCENGQITWADCANGHAGVTYDLEVAGDVRSGDSSRSYAASNLGYALDVNNPFMVRVRTVCTCHEGVTSDWSYPLVLPHSSTASGYVTEFVLNGDRTYTIKGYDKAKGFTFVGSKSRKIDATPNVIGYLSSLSSSAVEAVTVVSSDANGYGYSAIPAQAFAGSGGTQLEFGNPVVTASSYVLSWSAVPGADFYEVFVNGVATTTTELSFTVSGSFSSPKLVRVRSCIGTPASVVVRSGFSRLLILPFGGNEVTATSTLVGTTLQVHPERTYSHWAFFTSAGQLVTQGYLGSVSTYSFDLSSVDYSSFLTSDCFLFGGFSRTTSIGGFPSGYSVFSVLAVWHAIKTADLTYDSETQTIQGYDMTTLPNDDLIYTYSHYRNETKLADYPCTSGFSLSLADVADVQAGDSFVLSVSSETAQRSGSSNVLTLTEELLNLPDPVDPAPDTPDPDDPDNPNPDNPDPEPPADGGNVFDQLDALGEPWNILIYIAGGCLIVMALGSLFGRR